MVRIYSWDRRLLRALGDRFFGSLAVQDGNVRAGLSLVLAVDHTLLVGVQPGIDERLTLPDLSDFDGANCRRAVSIDDVGIGSLRALQHDRRRHRQAIMPRIEQQPYADEFARPQPMRRVGKFRLELDRAGRLQNLVVDQRELALVQLNLAV